MIIRAAKPSDAEAIVHVHYAAVQAIPQELYSLKWAWRPAWARFFDS